MASRAIEIREIAAQATNTPQTIEAKRGALGQAGIGLADALGDPHGPARLARLGGFDSLDQARELPGQRVGRVRSRQKLERAPLLVLVEPPVGGLGEHVGGVHQAFGLAQPSPVLHPTSQQVEDDEDEVDDRRGGLEEVVVVGGDELAELVDEEAEADPADDGGRKPDRGPHEREQHPERDQHEESAPEQVGDVQVPPPSCG
jgi:hypothetical protein